MYIEKYSIQSTCRNEKAQANVKCYIENLIEFIFLVFGIFLFIVISGAYSYFHDKLKPVFVHHKKKTQTIVTIYETNL